MKTEQNEILDILDDSYDINSGLGGKNLIITLSIFILCSLFVLPKIYLSNNIYYASRDISKLQYQYKSLKEENKILSQKLKMTEFKHQILDF